MRLALASAILALAIAPAASASTVQVVDDPYDDDDWAGETVVYTAADGEANDLSVEGDHSSVVVTDPGADITPGFGCVPSGVHSVTCSGVHFELPFGAALGDEDDRFVTKGPYSRVEGGSGEDALDGGSGGATLKGGDDADELDGGAFASTLEGGAGDDELNGGPDLDLLVGGPGADRIDGAGGLGYRDTVSYRDHTEGVTIDLSKPGSTAGAAGEGDTVTGVENAYGGAGDDEMTATNDVTSYGAGSVITGEGGDDTIEGGPGDDGLAGGEGDDLILGRHGYDGLAGGEGEDVLNGGHGDDFVSTRDGLEGPYAKDLVKCGTGRDATEPRTGHLPGQPLLDVFDQDCERIDLGGPALLWITHRHPQPPLRALRMRTACAPARCIVSVALRAHGRVVGRARRDIAGPANALLRIPLSAGARREVTKTGTLRLRVAVAVTYRRNLNHRDAFSYYYVLHRPAGVHRP